MWSKISIWLFVSNHKFLFLLSRIFYQFITFLHTHRLETFVYETFISIRWSSRTRMYSNFNELRKLQNCSRFSSTRPACNTLYLGFSKSLALEFVVIYLFIFIIIISSHGFTYLKSREGCNGTGKNYWNTGSLITHMIISRSK